jgi:nitrogenase molybdenum-cofactor synthesis protein NifE
MAEQISNQHDDHEMMETVLGKRNCVSNKPRPGGCAFCSARMALQPIVDAAHLIHGPIGCQAHSWEVRPTASSGPTLHRLALTTDLAELDLVHGGERRLSRALDHIVARYDPPAVFVYQTCVPAMTGDDISATCKAATARLQRPVIPVDAPGLAGGKLVGAGIAGDVLLDHVIGTREPAFSTLTDVVLIGE